MSDFVRLIVESSWQWRHESWLVNSGTSWLGGTVAGFRRGTLSRFLMDEPDVDFDEVPLVLWNRVPLYRYLRLSLATPLSLQKCCRMAAGGKLFAKVDQLAYPVSLKSFLKLQSD